MIIRHTRGKVTWVAMECPTRDEFEQVMTQFPAQRWLIIEDNLSIHTSRAVQMVLLAWPELQVQFLPKYACWLNLM